MLQCLLIETQNTVCPNMDFFFDLLQALVVSTTEILLKYYLYFSINQCQFNSSMSFKCCIRQSSKFVMPFLFIFVFSDLYSKFNQNYQITGVFFT
jgi:hypothetical protein